MRSDIRPGGVFPDYSLPNHTGTVRTQSDLQGRDPLIWQRPQAELPGVEEAWSHSVSSPP
jgi:hypothetical protein